MSLHDRFDSLAIDDAQIVEVREYYVSHLTLRLMAEVLVSDGNITIPDVVDVADLMVVTA